MKRTFILLLSVTVVTTIGFFSQKDKLSQRSSGIEKKIDEGENEEHEKETGAEKQLMMWFQSKGYPNPNNLSGKYQAAWQQYLEIKEKSSVTYDRTGSASNWASLGDVNNIGGRILCLTIDPNNSNNLWAGSASGGIWKSTNAGTSWESVPTNLPVLGVSSIIVNPSNSNVIYAGTGEVYRVDSSNIGFNVWKCRGTYGIGIIKSTDGGATWSQVMTKTTDQLFAIQMLKFDPTNSNTIYACATDGLYRSTNSGTSWSQILSKIYVSDVAINPSNTNQIVVGVGNMVNADKGIYRTTNGSNASPTWAKVAGGLPASFTGYIRMDNVGSTRLYASIGGASSGNELYLSTDFGANWSAKTGSAHCSFQYWFAHTLAINPSNTNDILIGGVDFYRYTSTNLTTGGSKSTISTNSSPIHSDHHDITYDPTNSNIIYVACDGGVYKSTNGGTSWSSRNTGLRATQFFASLGVSRNVSSPDRMIGGLQDNGQVLYNGTQWNPVSWGGGDGTSCAIDPSNHNNILASRDAKEVRRSTDGGSSGSVVTNYWGSNADSRTGFVAPLAFSLTSPTTVYLASDNLHKSSNSGGSFTNDPVRTNASTATNYIDAKNKTAIALAVSPINVNKVYVSTSHIAQMDNDVDGLIITGQPNVLKTTTGNTPFTSIKGTLPDRFVMDFAISDNAGDSVYVVLGGFGTSHVYLSPDGGTTWLSRGAGLPDVPFNAIVIDPVNESTIYAGCDFGVYVSPDRGATWYDYNTGFTDATLVMDLQIDANKKLIAATHGRGVFRSDLYTHTTLPVTMEQFTGTSTVEYNELQWSVSQEYNLNRYELERSDNSSNYSKIATVTPRGSYTQTTYTHKDYAPSFESYYRLKMIDNDGTTKYSSVVFLRKPAGTNEYSVLGNPFRDEIVLKCKVFQNQKIDVQLFSSNGAMLRRESYALVPGMSIYSIKGFDHLPSGSYILSVWDGKQKTSIKLLK